MKKKHDIKIPMPLNLNILNDVHGNTRENFNKIFGYLGAQHAWWNGGRPKGLKNDSRFLRKTCERKDSGVKWKSDKEWNDAMRFIFDGKKRFILVDGFWHPREHKEMIQLIPQCIKSGTARAKGGLSQHVSSFTND